MDNPFEILVYDRNYNFLGYVGNPISLEVTPRFNDVGTATIEMDLSHRLASQVMADGCRIVIKKDDLFIMSGRVTQTSSEGPSVTATLRVFVKSDFRLLKQILGWPDPYDIPRGTDEYGAYSGTAESVVKEIVTANMVDRLGMNVTVVANANRGGAIPDTEAVHIRWQPIYERVFPLVEQLGLGVTFEQHGTTIVCDVFEPPLYPFTLTEESGVVKTWAWASMEAAATRVLAGGEGDPATRLFSLVTNDDLEGSYGDVIETFEDVRDSGQQENLDAAAGVVLEDSGPKSGFSVTLAETANFNYGKNNLVVGAIVSINVGGVTRTDYLREVTMTYSRNDGIQVTPVVGDINNNPDRAIAKFLARLTKSISDMKVSK